MAEWSIAAVLKTVVLRGTGGSNPSLSAKECKHYMFALFFYVLSQGELKKTSSGFKEKMKGFLKKIFIFFVLVSFRFCCKQ